MNLPVSLHSICFNVPYILNIYDLYYFAYKTRIFGVPLNLGFENERMGLENKTA